MFCASKFSCKSNAYLCKFVLKQQIEYHMMFYCFYFTILAFLMEL